MKVLSFAVVGGHGREWWTRFAAGALVLAAAASQARAQSRATFVDLAPDLASKIAAELSPATSIRLSFPSDQERVQTEVARLLASLGVRVVETGGDAIVTGSCAENLRERVCGASIVRAATRRVVMATGARGAGTETARESVVAIEVRPVYTQRAPMLDVAEVGGRLLVLSPDSVSLVGETAAGNLTGRVIASQPIRTSRVWPRDTRGLLRTVATGFDAFLPGVVCRGTVTPFTLACADESEPWPLGLDNGGLTPSRNTFATPEGLTFYEAAPLDAGRWLVVGEHGVLTFLDAQRRATARAESADHTTGFPDACGADGPYVVTASRGSQAVADTLRLARADRGRLTPLPSAVVVPGVLTSLWRTPAAREATAVVHDFSAGRYEAFHLTLSCAR